MAGVVAVPPFILETRPRVSRRRGLSQLRRMLLLDWRRSKPTAIPKGNFRLDQHIIYRRYVLPLTVVSTGNLLGGGPPHFRVKDR